MKRLILVLTALVAAGAAQAASLARNPHAVPGARGAAVPLGATAIAQMSDNTPVSMGGVACSDPESGTTYDNSWWRRFSLAEHGAPSSLTIQSVMVGAETGSAPIVVRLYTIPHGVAAGTIARDQLREIGRSVPTMVYGNLDTTTIPVVGTLIDAVNHDLVVEYHTDGSPTSAFYPGANATPQTHEPFFSSTRCGFAEPTPVSEVGFPHAHMILVANAAAPAIAATVQFAPAVTTAAAPSRLTVTLANPFATPAALHSVLTVALPGGLAVAPVPNAATTCGGGIVAPIGATALTLAAAGAAIPAQGSCIVAVDVASSGGIHDVALAAGAVQTDRGANTHAARATLTVIPQGGNGIVRSGPLNRAMAATQLGTSYNMVTGTFNDAGTRNADWDLNLSLGLNDDVPAVLALTFNTIAANGTEFLVDADGHVPLLHDGDMVGPASTFSPAPIVMPAANWYAGADGAVGVRFRCEGRLTYPLLNGELCYGYIRLATSGLHGYPARVIESAYDGDGEKIAVVATAPGNPPAASVAPTALSFAVPANTRVFGTVTLSNAAGSDALRYVIAAQAESAPAQPRAEDLARLGSMPRTQTAPLFASRAGSVMQADVRGYAATPWTTPGGLPYRLDDGGYETTLGLGTAAAVWLNRYSLFEAQTIRSMSVMWPRQPDGGTLVGLTANLLAYYDADGDGDPTNAVRLGADTLVTIGVLDAFETYATNFVVPGTGDVYLGFSEHWARNGYPAPLVAAAVDADTWQGRSYVSARMPQEGVPPSIDIDHLGNNDITGMLPAIGFAGNFLIRATGADTDCGGPSVSWLTVTSVGDAVVGGAGVPIGVAIDPAAGDLSPGSYTAQLCIRTNDPARRTIVVPVGIVVTGPLVTHACSTSGDGIFCDRFDGAPADDIVTSGLVDVDLPQTTDGYSFDFAREEWSAWPLRGDDYAPYWHMLNPVLMFYWHGDVMPGASGGVAKTVFGPYEVLRPGDTIGPDSTFSQIANGAYGETGPFLAGVDGYLGVKFYNEALGRTNYGYIRIVTTWPSGYPATVIGYAYNRSGGPITIP